MICQYQISVTLGGRNTKRSVPNFLYCHNSFVNIVRYLVTKRLPFLPGFGRLLFYEAELDPPNLSTMLRPLLIVDRVRSILHVHVITRGDTTELSLAWN